MDYAPAAFTNLPAALERGLNLRGFVGYTGGSFLKPTSDNFVGIAARAGTGIKSIQDLRGKKVGVTFASTGDLYLRTVLEKNGIKTRPQTRTRPPMFQCSTRAALMQLWPGNRTYCDKIKGSQLVLRGGDYVCFCAGLHGSPEKVYGDHKKLKALLMLWPNPLRTFGI